MRRFETELIQFDAAPGDPYRPSSTPIYQTATFRQTPGECESYDYSRSGNPTRTILEQQLARLESGARGLAFSSGMAALDSLISLVPAGGQVVAGVDLYGGTFRLLTQVADRRGLETRFCDPCDERAFSQALVDRPALVLIETPSNPLFRITDIAATAELVHASGALLAIDNSLLSPYLQQPLKLGADIVVHSATKHLGGHSDVTAGALVSSSEEVGERLAFHQNAVGNALPAFDSWLLLRGLQTLALRLSSQQQNAERVARFLRESDQVKRIYYPTFLDESEAQIHFHQARGPGSVLSIETGQRGTSASLVRSLQLFSLTVSFGGLHSSVCMPSTMSHASIPPEVRAKRRFPEDLLRLSIGVEHEEDLIQDLETAFASLPKVYF